MNKDFTSFINPDMSFHLSNDRSCYKMSKYQISITRVNPRPLFREILYLPLFEIFKVLGFLQCTVFNRGTVHGTQTGNYNMYIFNLIQIQEKLTKIPPVSAVIHPPIVWIQHSVPLGKLWLRKKTENFNYLLL